MSLSEARCGWRTAVVGCHLGCQPGCLWPTGYLQVNAPAGGLSDRGLSWGIRIRAAWGHHRGSAVPRNSASRGCCLPLGSEWPGALLVAERGQATNFCACPTTVTAGTIFDRTRTPLTV